MKRILKWGMFSLVGITFLWVAYQVFFARTSCGIDTREQFTISTVQFGEFIEFIPQTGLVAYDEQLSNEVNVVVEIDEMYISRISMGLKGTSYINSQIYELEIVNVRDSIFNGRFKVDMKFVSELPPKISNGKGIRMRVELSDPSKEILLPVGGFYKDTGGKWVFVIHNGTEAIRREVKLGRKNTEHFVVLEGLKPGEQVITSSYERFTNNKKVDIANYLFP
jgi:hypothetical protein